MSIRNESPISNARIFDVDLELKDAGLVAASAAAQVGGSDKIIDLGLGKQHGEVVIDITAVEIASNDEVYDIILQLSNSATFASGIVNATQMNFAATEVADGGADDAVVGRYHLPFQTVYADTHYQYARLYTEVAGTIATGINYSAFITKFERG